MRKRKNCDILRKIHKPKVLFNTKSHWTWPLQCGPIFRIINRTFRKTDRKWWFFDQPKNGTEKNVKIFTTASNNEIGISDIFAFERIRIRTSSCSYIVECSETRNHMSNKNIKILYTRWLMRLNVSCNGNFAFMMNFFSIILL